MELNNDFEVSAPIEKVWEVINNVELIAPCLPGAQLEDVENDEYRVVVKVKVGQITALYKGVAKFVEKDDSNHRVVIRGEGRDTRGAGNAAADITASLESITEGTRVNVVTDLKITGKVAQFGRGVMADISKKLMGQFADNLSELVLAEGGNSQSSNSEDSSGQDSEAIDLLSVAGSSIGKKLVPGWIRNRQKKT